MPLSKDTLHQEAHDYISQALHELESMGCHIGNWSIDHLCYRVPTTEDYSKNKDILSRCGTLLTESEVAGRPIATYKLHTPIQVDGRIVDLLELPAPKSGKACAEGFEHIEVVLPIPFQDLISSHPHLAFDTSGLRKPFNQELKLSTAAGVVKFHHLSLESVIGMETAVQAYNALRASNILNCLHEFQPLIAGTIPLGLDLPQSDLDIIVSAWSLPKLQDAVRERYGACAEFHDQVTTVHMEASYVARFYVDEIKFEVFGQEKSSVLGQAYQHFLIEERLLKVHGDSLRQRVMQLRQTENLKTEPAFAKALGLCGDPYMELLKLADHQEAELY